MVAPGPGAKAIAAHREEGETIGEGANLAMYDGAELGRALATQPDVEAALTEYELAMFTRSAEDAAQTAELTTTAPENLINVFKDFDRT